MSKVVKVTVQYTQVKEVELKFSTDVPDDEFKKWLKERCDKQGVEESHYPHFGSTDVLPTKEFLDPLFHKTNSNNWTVQKVSISKGKLPQYLEDNECTFDKEIKEWMGENE